MTYSLFASYSDDIQKKNLYEKVQWLRTFESFKDCAVFDYSSEFQIGGIVVLENVDAEWSEFERLDLFRKFVVRDSVFDWRREQHRVEQIVV